MISFLSLFAFCALVVKFLVPSNERFIKAKVDRMKKGTEQFKNPLRNSPGVYGFFFYTGQEVRSNRENCLIYLGDRQIPVPAPQPLPAPPPKVQPGAPPPEAPVPARMVRIPEGTFMMGSPPSETGRRDNEGPQHQVSISSFYLGKHEVTQQEYQGVMGTNPSYFKGNNLPVENVSWYDAVNYCNARSRKEGLTPPYRVKGTSVTWNRTAEGYRLPTEAEWEYACRAGTSTPYYSGNPVDTLGWYKSNSGSKTHPVGGKQANPWGLYDMHGNVLEWCWDWYGSYSAGSATDPSGASSGSHRARRGGSWYFQGRNLRSASRSSLDPSLRFFYLGFRVVRQLPVP